VVQIEFLVKCIAPIRSSSDNEEESSELDSVNMSALKFLLRLDIGNFDGGTYYCIVSSITFPRKVGLTT